MQVFYFNSARQISASFSRENEALAGLVEGSVFSMEHKFSS